MQLLRPSLEAWKPPHWCYILPDVLLIWQWEVLGATLEEMPSLCSSGNLQRLFSPFYHLHCFCLSMFSNCLLLRDVYLQDAWPTVIEFRSYKSVKFTPKQISLSPSAFVILRKWVQHWTLKLESEGQKLKMKQNKWVASTFFLVKTSSKCSEQRWLSIWHLVCHFQNRSPAP